MSESSQFSLLGQRRFLPFFLAQFLGAANDNLFKFAFTVLVTYQLQVSWLEPKMAGLVIGALFILPFVLFSATSGQWADKYDKAFIMRSVKLMEVGIMVLAGLGFWFSQVPLLLGCVFLMGLHSTFFGPVKYAYLPQHLREHELTWGPVSETWRNLRLAWRYPSVFRSLLGISWMWFFGAVFLAQFPSFARDVLHGNEQVASLLLV